MIFGKRKSMDTTPPRGSVHQQRVRQLNGDFLRLLAQQPELGASDDSYLGRLALPAPHAAALSALPRAIDAMAECPVSLFDLGLHRIESWQTLIKRITSVEPRHAVTSSRQHDSPFASFGADALLFAWHLAQAEPQTARVLLGMREEVAVLLASLEPSQCRQLTSLHGQLLATRWRDNPYFWPDLLRYGGSHDVNALRFISLLGSQLLAKDLEPSAIMRCSATLA